jgi:hypothetical protein
MTTPALPSKLPGVLALVTEARSLLAQATTIHEVKDIRDKAQALRDYVKQQGECLEVQNAAAEIKIRAERRAGEILDGMWRDMGGRPKETPDIVSEVSEYRQALDESGLNDRMARRFQQIASVPDAVFEGHIEEIKGDGKELTSAGVLRIAPRKEPKSAPAERDIHDAVNELIDKVHAIAERWPEGKTRILAEKLIDLGRELLANGEIAA